MRQTWVFAAFALGLVAMVLLVARPLLGASGWTALAVAGMVGWSAQVALRLLLTPWRRDAKQFMKAIAAGAIGRMLVVAVAIVWVAVRGHAHPVLFLIGLAGFLFVLLMLEAFMENSKRFRTSEPRHAEDGDAESDAGEDVPGSARSLAHG